MSSSTPGTGPTENMFISTGSHIPILAFCVINFPGSILELGCGWYSTPLLHCLAGDRRLLTLENEKEWFDQFKKFQSATHEIRLIDDWDKVNIEGEPWGIAFVDHHPGPRRIVEIERLKDVAKIIVIHDVEAPGYHYEAIWGLFKFVYTCRWFPCWTAIASQTDLAAQIGPLLVEDYTAVKR